MTFIEKITGRFKPGGIGRQISWLLFQSGVEAVTMTIAALLAARWFGPAPLGQLGILLAGVQLVTLLGDGFFPTIIKYVSEARARGNAAAAWIGWRFAWIALSVLAAAALVTGVVAYAVFQSQLTLLLVLLAVLLATGRGWRAALDGAYRGVQEFRIPAFAGSICTTVMAGCIIGLAASGYRVTMYLTVMVVGTAINCILLAWAYNSKFLNTAVTHDRLDAPGSAFLKYSLPLALRGLSAFLFLKINILMLGGMASLADAGQFRLTDQFLTIPALFLSSTLAAVAPRIVAAQLAGTAQLELFLSRVYGLMLVLTIPLAVFFWFNGPLLHLFFPAFEPASRMLTFFAPAMAVMGLGYAASIIPVQGGKPGLALSITAASGVVNVGAAYAGLKLNGVMGLAMATAAVHFLTYTAGIAITHWVFGLKFKVRFN